MPWKPKNIEEAVFGLFAVDEHGELLNNEKPYALYGPACYNHTVTGPVLGTDLKAVGHFLGNIPIEAYNKPGMWRFRICLVEYQGDKRILKPVAKFFIVDGHLKLEEEKHAHC